MLDFESNFVHKIFRMSQAAEFKERLRKLLTKPGFINDTLTHLEQKTKVQRIYPAYGFIGLASLWVIWGWGAPLLANFLLLYPAYWSIKTLETNNYDDDKKWLTYWVVFAFFSVLEYFSSAIVYMIPSYWLWKCLVMVWCMMPGTNNGAVIIYNIFIRPKYVQHQNDLDKLVVDAQSMMGGFVNSVKNESRNLVAEHLVRGRKN